MNSYGEEFQLRYMDNSGDDTGEIRVFDSFAEAFSVFLAGDCWKLSFYLNGRRFRILRDWQMFSRLEITVFDNSSGQYVFLNRESAKEIFV